MSTNALIQTTRPTVSEIVSRFRAESYYVDNSFQRKLVWTPKQKARLIETVLTGYPMPELYLWQQQADPDTGLQKHSIVDGQQRITTLVQFVSNEWPLKKPYLDETNQQADFADKKWENLDQTQKQTIWNYVINVRTIPNEVSGDTVRTIFKRLNETDKSLNPQELRNAEFNGSFITAAEEVANDSHWRIWNVFPDSQIRRMADIQLASSMLVFLRRGVVGDTTDSVNEIYDMYNDVYEEREQDISKIVTFLARAETSYFTSQPVREFFTKPLHIYALFCADSISITPETNLVSIAQKLIAFVSAYQSDAVDDLVEKYRMGSSSRTRSKASRDRRVDALIGWLARPL